MNIPTVIFVIISFLSQPVLANDGDGFVDIELAGAALPHAHPAPEDGGEGDPPQLIVHEGEAAHPVAANAEDAQQPAIIADMQRQYGRSVLKKLPLLAIGVAGMIVASAAPMSEAASQGIGIGSFILTFFSTFLCLPDCTFLVRRA